ncbi:MAG: prenyltransferase [Methanospirillum sp.]
MFPVLVRLLRPQFTVIGLILFAVGALYASALGAVLSPVALAAAYLCMFVGHLSVHAVNDYFDREDDRHGTPTPFSGGSGVLQADPALAPAALVLGIGLSALSLLGTGVYWLAFGPNPWFAGLIVAALLLGWAYSAPPLRFSARGMGEVSTALAFVLMPGFGYAAAAGRLDAGFVPFALPLLLLGFSFILAVELPDLEADTAAGRRNFTVRHGRAGAVRGMLVGTGAAMAVYAVLAANGIGPLPAALAGLALSSLPFASAVLATSRLAPSRDGAIRACGRHMAALNLLMIGLGVALVAAR